MNTINTLKNEYLIPNKSMISSVYPNPFNPSTMIEFDLELNEIVSLKIYNLNGQLIENLINDHYYDAGFHKLVWDASDYSSGIYLLQLKTSNTIQTEKLLLVK